jgi:hypothetical protein
VQQVQSLETTLFYLIHYQQEHIITVQYK